MSSWAEAENAYKNAGGKCQICEHDQMRNLALDHCPDTGNLRGVLCARCSMGIRHFSDNTGLLAKAIEYLNAHTIKTHSIKAE
jgi:hypothetical protein